MVLGHEEFATDEIFVNLLEEVSNELAQTFLEYFMVALQVEVDPA